MTNFKQSKHAISVHDGWQKKKNQKPKHSPTFFCAFLWIKCIIWIFTKTLNNSKIILINNSFWVGSNYKYCLPKDVAEAYSVLLEMLGGLRALPGYMKKCSSKAVNTYEMPHICW